MSENRNQVCNQCNNHCPVDNLKCGKGRRYFASQLGETTADGGKSEHGDERSGTGYGHHKMFEAGDNKKDDLLSLLDKSSHFLHHKRGGKRGQGKILKILAANPEISQKEVQEMLEIQPGSMSEIVMKLEKKGLISRTKDETDKRMTKLMITEAGLEKSKEMDSRNVTDDEHLLDSLSQEEQEEMKILLLKLVNAWEETYGMSHVDRRSRLETKKDSKNHDRGHDRGHGGVQEGRHTRHPNHRF